MILNITTMVTFIEVILLICMVLNIDCLVSGNYGKREISSLFFYLYKYMRSQTVIYIRWKLTNRVEVFVNLGKLYAHYNNDELGVSRWTLDRKDLYDGYETEFIELKISMCCSITKSNIFFLFFFSKFKIFIYTKSITILGIRFKPTRFFH